VRTEHAVAAQNAALTETYPLPGDKMPDGTIYAGVSPDTQRPMYRTQEDSWWT
jgi:hypothetical protein